MGERRLHDVSIGDGGHRRRLAGPAFRIAVAAILMWLLARQMDAWQRVPNLWSHLNSAQGYFALALTLFIILARAIRWNTILGAMGRAFPAGELAVVYGTSLFLGLVTPGKIGEGSRIWFARDRATGGLPTAAFTVAFDKLLDVVPTVLFALAFLLGSGASPIAASTSTWTALAIVVACLAFVMLRPSALQSVLELIGRRVRPSRASPSANKLNSTAALTFPALMKALLCSVAIHALALVQSMLFADSVGIELPIMSLYGAICVGAVAAALPVSIGGLGSREVALVLALELQSIPEPMAVDFSLFHFVNSLLTAAITAPFFSMHRWRR